VNPRTVRRALTALWLAVALAPAATLSRHPYLQNVRPDRATVMWTTLEPGGGAVEYSTDRKNWLTASARTRQFAPAETALRTDFYQFEAELRGLAAGTQYSYRVLVDGRVLAEEEGMRFRTPGPGPFQFLIFGDSGVGSPEQARLARLIEAERPALVLHVGDVAQGAGNFHEYEDYYFPFYRELMKRAPFFPTPGNHDYLTRNAAAYLAVHSLPAEGVPEPDRGRYYSFDWGNVHFVSLDTNLPFSEALRGSGPMLDWLERDLSQTRKFWRVAWFHHSPYASGFHRGDAVRADLRARLIPILERHGVQVVFHGHEHSYQRTLPLRDGEPAEGQGTIYITTGGGGASLYPFTPHPLMAFGERAHHYMRVEVDGAKMTLRAIRIDGQEIDRVTLAPAPSLAETPVVNAASFTPRLAPGAVVSIFGESLAGEERVAESLPLPQDLGGVSVTFNDQPAPLFYVSSSQINAQLHFDSSGLALLRVNTPNGSAEAVVLTTGTAPAVFTVPAASGRQAAVAHATTGGLVTREAPAAPGEFVTVYLTGLGRMDGSVVAGYAAPRLAARASVTVLVGGATLQPSYAGLAPGLAGVCQVNFQVPEGLAAGFYPLVISAAGASSEPVELAVAAAPAVSPVAAVWTAR